MKALHLIPGEIIAWCVGILIAAAVFFVAFYPVKSQKNCTVVKLTYPDGRHTEWHNSQLIQWDEAIRIKHGQSTVYVLHSGAFLTVYETPFLEHAEKVEQPKEEP